MQSSSSELIKRAKQKIQMVQMSQIIKYSFWFLSFWKNAHFCLRYEAEDVKLLVVIKPPPNCDASSWFKQPDRILICLIRLFNENFYFPHQITVLSLQSRRYKQQFSWKKYRHYLQSIQQLSPRTSISPCVVTVITQIFFDIDCPFCWRGFRPCYMRQLTLMKLLNWLNVTDEGRCGSNT